NQLQSLVPAVAALAPELSPEQAQAALGRVLDAIANTTFPPALQSLAQAVAALAPRLTPEPAQAAFAQVPAAWGWAAIEKEAAEVVNAMAAIRSKFKEAKS